MTGDSVSRGGGGTSDPGGAGKPGEVEHTAVFAAAAAENGECERDSAYNNTSKQLPGGGGDGQQQQQNATNRRRHTLSRTGDMEIPAAAGEQHA